MLGGPGEDDVFHFKGNLLDMNSVRSLSLKTCAAVFPHKVE